MSWSRTGSRSRSWDAAKLEWLRGNQPRSRESERGQTEVTNPGKV